MKKFLTLSALLGSLIIFAPSHEAKAAAAGSNNLTAAANAQPGLWQGRRRGVRVVNRTRIVRRGFATYREVVQYRYRPNGSVVMRVISRTRVR